MLAMALSALWPLLSQARPRSVHLVPLCTVEGVTHYLEVPGGKSPLEQRSASHAEHCQLCVFGVDRSSALPTTQVVLVFADRISPVDPARDPLRLPAALHHPPAQPRAPPSLS